MEVSKVAEGKLERKQLDSNDVFIIDNHSEVFVWIGKGANTKEREQGMAHANAFVKEQKRENVPITRIVEMGETPVFRALFAKWEEPKKVEKKVRLSVCSL
jgi:hypothetical protein